MLKSTHRIAVVGGPVFVVRGGGPRRPHGAVKTAVVGDIQVAMAPAVGQGGRVDDVGVGVDSLTSVALLGGRKLSLLPEHRVLIVLFQVLC